jgi:hypothetical protein
VVEFLDEKMQSTDQYFLAGVGWKPQNQESLNPWIQKAHNSDLCKLYSLEFGGFF